MNFIPAISRWSRERTYLLAGTYLDKMMDGGSGARVRREHGERVRAAYLGALHARREIARLMAEGALPGDDAHFEADRAAHAALFKLLTAVSGHFVDSKEGYFAHLSTRDLWARFRILERRFDTWVTADPGEPSDTLAVRWVD